MLTVVDVAGGRIWVLKDAGCQEGLVEIIE